MSSKESAHGGKPSLCEQPLPDTQVEIRGFVSLNDPCLSCTRGPAPVDRSERHRTLLNDRLSNVAGWARCCVVLVWYGWRAVDLTQTALIDTPIRNQFAPLEAPILPLMGAGFVERRWQRRQSSDRCPPAWWTNSTPISAGVVLRAMSWPPTRQLQLAESHAQSVQL